MINKNNEKKMKQSKLRILSLSELITHAIFWLGYLWLTLNSQMLFISLDSLDSGMLNTNDSQLPKLLNILSFYWFYCFVIPRYFISAHLKFIFVTLISIVIFVEINNIAILVTSEHRTDIAQGISYLLSLAVQFFWAIWALFIHRIFANLKRNTKSKEQEIQHTKTELAFLKQQIHPHFLFNVLNSLYSSSYKYGDTKTSEGIGQLADLLRYMLYETQSDKVPIKEELTYLNSYIDLQMLRFSEDVTHEYTNNEVGHNIDVAPMLFITLIENAYKKIGRKRPSFKTNPTAWRSFLYYPDRLVGFEHIS
jgi:sensor histidine kinase YesM